MRAKLSPFFLLILLLNGCAQIKHLDNHDRNRDVNITSSNPEKNGYAVSASLSKGFNKTDRIDTLDRDGAWCWFADPRAVHLRWTLRSWLPG